MRTIEHNLHRKLPPAHLTIGERLSRIVQIEKNNEPSVDWINQFAETAITLGSQHPWENILTLPTVEINGLTTTPVIEKLTPGQHTEYIRIGFTEQKKIKQQVLFIFTPDGYLDNRLVDARTFKLVPLDRANQIQTILEKSLQGS